MFIIKDTLTGGFYVNPHEDHSWIAGEGDIPRTYKTAPSLKGCITRRTKFNDQMLDMLNADPKEWADTWGSTRADCDGDGWTQVNHILDRQHLENYGMVIVEVDVTVVHQVTIKEKV